MVMGARIAAMGPAEWALLLALSILWGGTFFFAEIALEELRPLTLVLCRVGIAAGALVLVVHATGHRVAASARLWGAFALMGVLNNLIPFALIFWSQTRITGSLAAILNATTPLFAVVLAHVLTRNERLSGNRLAGVALGLRGVIVMVGPAALAELGRDLLAQVAVLAAALSYALAGIFGRRFGDLPPVVSAAGQVLATTVLLAPVVLIVEPPWSDPVPDAPTWAAVVGLALLSTSLAYVLYFRLLASAGATNLLLVTFLIPVTAIVLCGTLLDERLTPPQLAGMVLIGLGLATIDGRPLRALRLARRRPRTSSSVRTEFAP
jgi:drug/metabolite transporter (DMT)-like permease